jgi:hypothetical protein
MNQEFRIGGLPPTGELHSWLIVFEHQLSLHAAIPHLASRRMVSLRISGDALTLEKMLCNGAMTKTADLPVHVCGHRLTSPRHICCFFDSREQQYDVLTPYFKEGLKNGEEVFCIMEGHFVEEHRGRLCAKGVDVAGNEASGHLKTTTSDDTYLADGRFGKERMYNVLASRLADLKKSKFTGIRTCGDMEWALRNMPGTEELMEYESEVNRLLTDRDDATFVCVYDANRIGGRAMIDILSTHTHVVMGNIVHENPYHMSPDAYRRSFLARRMATTSLSAG